MFLFAWTVWLNLCVASSDDLVPDQDDTLLLQTRASTKEVKKPRSKNIHRLQLEVQESGISLIQADQNTGAVFQICAGDDSGNSEETVDVFDVTTDSCGSFDLTNEDGEQLGVVTGCFKHSVEEGTCFNFVGQPEWSSNSLANTLVSVPCVVSDNNDVLLIEVPTMDQSRLEQAHDQIQKQMKEFPGAHVLLYGKGARDQREHMGWVMLAMWAMGQLWR